MLCCAKSVSDVAMTRQAYMYVDRFELGVGWGVKIFVLNKGLRIKVDFQFLSIFGRC